MDVSFEVNRRYKYKGTWRDPDDQFLRWIRGPLSAGIKNTGGIRPLSFEDGEGTAALILISNDEGVSQHEDPWQDNLDVSAGHIEYWGDAKTDNPYDESTHNRKIKRAFEQSVRGDRSRVPPVLVFRKPEPGVVQFCGLCVPETIEVCTYRDESGTQIPNYLFHFTIVNAQRVPVEWLHNRSQRSDEAEDMAPPEWTKWEKEGVISRWPLGDRIDDTTGYRRRVEREETVVSAQFRDDTLARFDHSCVVTGIGESAVLDVAHILSRSDHPELVEDDSNVLVMNSLHHRAFDADLFTLDSEMEIRVNPAFDPGHPFLRETILKREREEVSLPTAARTHPDYLQERNTALAWL